MGLLNKDAILAAEDKKFEDVDVPEWGGSVRVRMMSASERDQWENETYGTGKVNTVDFRARFVALCAIDEAGNLLFTPDDVDALGAKSAAAVQRVFNAAQKLNALSAKDIQDLEKNSDAAQSGASSSNSPGASDTPIPT